MNLTIDTTKKTIIINEDVNMEELINELSDMFPEDEWSEFKILTPYTHTTGTTSSSGVTYNPTCTTGATLYNGLNKFNVSSWVVGLPT